MLVIISNNSNVANAKNIILKPLSKASPIWGPNKNPILYNFPIERKWSIGGWTIEKTSVGIPLKNGLKYLKWFNDWETAIGVSTEYSSER